MVKGEAHQQDFWKGMDSEIVSMDKDFVFFMSTTLRLEMKLSIAGIFHVFL